MLVIHMGLHRLPQQSQACVSSSLDTLTKSLLSNVDEGTRLMLLSVDAQSPQEEVELERTYLDRCKRDLNSVNLLVKREAGHLGPIGLLPWGRSSSLFCP
jgi:hypothetical protein